MVTFLIWVVLKCCWDSEANSWAEPGLFLYFGMWVLQQERVPNTWIGIRGWKFQCRLHGGWITSTPLRYFPLLENPISKVMRSVIELPPTSYLCCNLYKYVLQFVGFNGDTRSINPLEKKETIWTSSNNNWWVFSLIAFCQIWVLDIDLLLLLPFVTNAPGSTSDSPRCEAQQHLVGRKLGCKSQRFWYFKRNSRVFLSCYHQIGWHCWVSNSLYNKLSSYNIPLAFINIYKYTYINNYACMYVFLQAVVFVLTFLSLDCFQRQSEKIWTSQASLMKSWFLSLDKIMKFASWFDGCLWLRYIDPQYYMKRQLTPASDVYSYGVVLLELITGQRAINENNQGDELNNLVQWVHTYIHTYMCLSASQSEIWGHIHDEFQTIQS